MASTPKEIDQRIWQVVMLIPPGTVATYGDVARQAGLPGAARRVGRALRGLPEDTRIPWHRVLNAQGKLVVPGGGSAQQRQRRRLESEGVVFRSVDGISLRQYRWQPGGGPQ
tara:strand:- start:96645 stop:96980 length:336 start_codon:yes stop_codon:yes gene_type:complete